MLCSGPHEHIRTRATRGSLSAPEERCEASKVHGIGLSNYIEITSGEPRERREITVQPDVRLEAVMGT